MQHPQGNSRNTRYNPSQNDYLSGSPTPQTPEVDPLQQHIQLTNVPRTQLPQHENPALRHFQTPM